MSKAYDSVNFNLFKHSLLRLSLPQPIINILSNLLINRQNEVITNFGLTSSYQVQNGIDQGETITPLLWRIYYDPLISYIYTHFPEFTISTKWPTNLKNFSTQQLHTNCLVLAYMDDTLWIASSQTELTNILAIAESFYTIPILKLTPQSQFFHPTLNPTPIILLYSIMNHSLSGHPTSLSSFLAAGLLSTINLLNNANLSLQSHLNLSKSPTENKLLTLKPDTLLILS
jgi:hypothetical protein